MSLPRKHLFELPEGIVYLDGNSLGPLPKAVPERLRTVVDDEWARGLIRSWNSAGWMGLPDKVGDKIGRLIGAPSGSVVVGDTLSIKVYQALAAALRMQSDSREPSTAPGSGPTMGRRRTILSDSGNFPGDLYMANGLISLLQQDYELRVVEPDAVANAIDDTVAVVLLTEVDYRTGRRHDAKALTAAAHEAGAVMIWDLAHSTGAVVVDVADWGCDFAVGCTYKYLNGGPGAPAFIYVRPDLIADAVPALSGWMGHDRPFDFALDYQPSSSIERFRVGTPAILQMSVLEAALSAFDGIDMADVYAASQRLSERFVAEVDARCAELALVSPRDPDARGSQVSYRFTHGYAAMQALIAHGVIGDFRAPDLMRFGFTPLYLSEDDVVAAVDVLVRVLEQRLYELPEFHVRGRVT